MVEGVVMHYGATNFGGIGYFYTNTCNTNAAKPYTVKKAQSYYKKHKEDIKAYYSSCGDDYEADPEFASNVSAIPIILALSGISSPLRPCIYPFPSYLS